FRNGMGWPCLAANCWLECRRARHGVGWRESVMGKTKGESVMEKILRKLFSIGICALSFSLPVWGQAFTASVIGTVTDNTGAAVPEAIVAITHLSTKAPVSILTDS